MGKKNKQSRPAGAERQKPRPPADAASQETKAADAATVAWMLATLATTLALFFALLLQALISLGIFGKQAMLYLFVLSVTALASGIVTLLLTVPVLRIRYEEPPRAITFYAVAVSIASLVWPVLFFAFG